MEPIMHYLKRRLLEVGPPVRDAIAAETGIDKGLLRKIAYGDRKDCLISSAEPVLIYLQAIDRGEKQLPAPRKEAA